VSLDLFGPLTPVPGSPFGGRLDGPVWDGQALLFCRVEANEIHRFDPVTGLTTRLRHSTSATRGLAFGPDGRLFGAQARSRRVVWYEAGGATFYLNAMLDGGRHNEPQDLVVDAAGRIWFSDDWTEESVIGPVGWPPLDHCSVLRLRQTAETEDRIGTWVVERMTVDTQAPRGLALSADQSSLYVVDRGDGTAVPATLRAYPIADAGLGQVSVIVDFGLANGDDGPHGLAVCANGRLAVAVGRLSDARGPAVEVYDTDGQLLQRLDVGGGVPTNCAFGGPGLRTLYVTTSDGHLVETTADLGGDR
jgi:gluconolactonase